VSLDVRKLILTLGKSKSFEYSTPSGKKKFKSIKIAKSNFDLAFKEK
jgi:hypothetical protein